MMVEDVGNSWRMYVMEMTGEMWKLEGGWWARPFVVLAWIPIEINQL